MEHPFKPLQKVRAPALELIGQVIGHYYNARGACFVDVEYLAGGEVKSRYFLPEQLESID